MSRKIKVIELFSGMGGMHYALSQAKKLSNEAFDFEVVRAIDISDVANQVYKHNFPEVDLKGSNICGLTAEQLTKMKVEAIFMSPPCQPFTRQGNQKDLGDSRTQPLVHITDNLIPNVASLNYILLENVKGFETSDAHKKLIETLQKCGFSMEEFLLCPKQLGIPNSRLRYYVIAKRTSKFSFAQSQDGAHQVIRTDVSDLKNLCGSISQMFHDQEQGHLKNYINIADDPFQNHLEKLELEGKILDRHGEVLDIVSSGSRSSCCFTKSYGRYAEGTGSVLHQAGNVDQAYDRARLAKSPEDKINCLKELKLRYFTPYEVAKLMGFPLDKFEFPKSYIDKPLHCYRVLGNSLNVSVVTFLTLLMFMDDLGIVEENK